MERIMCIGVDDQAAVLSLADTTYQTLKNLTGYHLEIVRPMRLGEGLVMVVDEEGLLKKMPFNKGASWLYGMDQHGGVIVGKVYIFREIDAGDGLDLVGLSQADIEQIKRVLAKGGSC